MSKHYSPKRFFRQSPNRFLKRYFEARNAIHEIDFDTLREADADPIYEAWLKLPDNARNEMEKDFQEIDELAAEAGSKAILDEARFHGEDLAVRFAELDGFHEHSFWTFLERPKCWPGAVAFHHADTIPSSYWRKRKNLPRKAAAVDADSIREFEESLGNYFHTKQGRGKNCKIDCYRRNDLDYFFAYPEDYANASIEWVGPEFKRRPFHPAFEVIFVYSQEEGKLDIYLTGDRKPVPDLQEIFAKTILKAEIGDDEEDERVYDLVPFRSRDFRFVYGPESGIEKVIVNKLKLSIHGRSKEKITLETDALYHRDAIFDLYDKATKDFLPSQILIHQVGVKATFVQNSSSRRKKSCPFTITWPNSCSLKHEGRHLILRKMLVDSGIEPREPDEEEEIA